MSKEYRKQKKRIAHHHVLGDISLDIQHRTKLKQHHHQGGVRCRWWMGEEGDVSYGGLQALNTKTVFYTDRQTVKWS